MRTIRVCLLLVILTPFLPSAALRAGDGLLAVWHFDEGQGTRALDSSGDENDAEVHGAQWVPGLFGQALRFNGVDSCVVAPGFDELSQGSVEAWVNFDAVPSGPGGRRRLRGGAGGKERRGPSGIRPRPAR